MRLDNLPVAVYSADWWLLRWNPPWTSLLGDPAEVAGRDRNLVWQVFGTRGWRAAPADHPLTEFQRALVSDLRVLLVEHPADEQLADLVKELRRMSPDFAEQWAEGTAARHRSERKNVAHPDLGNLLLDCDVLQVPESNVHLLVYSAEPGSKDARRLKLPLRDWGVQCALEHARATARAAGSTGTRCCPRREPPSLKRLEQVS